jgi:tripartite-type tricarboxylate transporter receptor subunit TctC
VTHASGAGLSRRHLLAGASFAGMTGLWTALPMNAAGQQNVTRLVVPFAAGGPADILARLFVDAQLGELYGRKIIVDNKPGASGIVGTQFVARSPADGNTFLMTPTFFLQNAVAYEKPGYDPIKDFVPVAPIGTTFIVFTVSGQNPANTMAEFVADARRQGDRISFASPGLGTSNHLAGVALNKVAGIDMNHVPYKGDLPGLQDLVGGHVTCGFFAMSTIRPFLADGRVKPLAVVRVERQPELPNVPTLVELGLDHPVFRTIGWFAVFAPTGTPQDLVDKIGNGIAALLKKPEIEGRLRDYGITPWSEPRSAFAAQLAQDYRAWQEIIPAAGVKLNF